MVTNRTSIGIGNGISMGRNIRANSIDIDPKLLASIKMVCIVGDKKDTDPDAAVVKDITGKGNDLFLYGYDFSNVTDGNTYYTGRSLEISPTTQVESKTTLKDILLGSNEITVLSRIRRSGFYSESISLSRLNCFCEKTNSSDGMYITGTNIEKINDTICGYSSSDIIQGLISTIEGILGDGKYYSSHNVNVNLDYNFSISGNELTPSQYFFWYWTVIANKVLTENEINKVIEYYKLDEYIYPTIYFDIKKLGITNDNHMDFDDSLINYSPYANFEYLNMSLVSFNWNLNSGIVDDKLCFSGDRNYGSTIIMSPLTDYTILARIKDNDHSLNAAFLSKTSDSSQGAFHTSSGGMINSFGGITSVSDSPLDEYIYRLTKYKYNNDTLLNVGTVKDSSNIDLLLGKLVPSASGRFKGYMKWVLVYDTTLNEFLLDRQLKRLGLTE